MQDQFSSKPVLCPRPPHGATLIMSCSRALRVTHPHLHPQTNKVTGSFQGMNESREQHEANKNLVVSSSVVTARRYRHTEPRHAVEPNLLAYEATCGRGRDPLGGPSHDASCLVSYLTPEIPLNCWFGSMYHQRHAILSRVILRSYFTSLLAPRACILDRSSDERRLC
jgi:hypothetical protein